MSIDVEPFPVEGGILWDEGSPQWLTRYEYIEERSERYLNSYRDSMDYDFTRTLGGVKYNQLAVKSAYERFAAGSLTVLGVKNQVIMLRDAYRRKEVKPLTPEEIEKANEKPEYVPQWRKDWDKKKEAERQEAYRKMIESQPSPDQAAFITERAYSIRTDGVSPMPGIACYSVTEDEGYLADGTRVDGGQAYLVVLWDCQDHYYPEKRDRRPANLTGLPEPEPPPERIETKSLDEIKQDQALQEQERRLRKRLNRGKRSNGGN